MKKLKRKEKYDFIFQDVEIKKKRRIIVSTFGSCPCLFKHSIGRKKANIETDLCSTKKKREKKIQVNPNYLEFRRIVKYS